MNYFYLNLVYIILMNYVIPTKSVMGYQAKNTISTSPTPFLRNAIEYKLKTTLFYKTKTSYFHKFILYFYNSQGHFIQIFLCTYISKQYFKNNSIPNIYSCNCTNGRMKLNYLILADWKPFMELSFQIYCSLITVNMQLKGSLTNFYKNLKMRHWCNFYNMFSKSRVTFYY